MQEKIEKLRADVAGITEHIRAERDELRLKLHLGEAELRDEWTTLEKKWQTFEARVRAVGNAAGESADEVREAVELLAGELRAGYGRMRRAMKQ